MVNAACLPADVGDAAAASSPLDLTFRYQMRASMPTNSRLPSVGWNVLAPWLPPGHGSRQTEIHNEGLVKPLLAHRGIACLLVA